MVSGPAIEPISAADEQGSIPLQKERENTFCLPLTSIILPFIPLCVRQVELLIPSICKPPQASRPGDPNFTLAVLQQSALKTEVPFSVNGGHLDDRAVFQSA